ncbi:MAG: hypothetical protein QUS07_07185 [Methanothrix sp.]|nr:hypothetical protein [Methanothrix sp.]
MNIFRGQEVFDQLPEVSQQFLQTKAQEVGAVFAVFSKDPDLFKGRGRILEGTVRVSLMSDTRTTLYSTQFPGKTRKLKRPPSDTDDFCEPMEEGDEQESSRPLVSRGFRGDPGPSESIGGVPWDVQSTVGTDEGLDVRCANCHQQTSLHYSIYGFKPSSMDKVDHFCPDCADALGVISLDDADPSTYGM